MKKLSCISKWTKRRKWGRKTEKLEYFNGRKNTEAPFASCKEVSRCRQDVNNRSPSRWYHCNACVAVHYTLLLYMYCSYLTEHYKYTRWSRTKDLLLLESSIFSVFELIEFHYFIKVLTIWRDSYLLLVIFFRSNMRWH